jgi:hypothetical protein
LVFVGSSAKTKGLACFPFGLTKGFASQFSLWPLAVAFPPELAKTKGKARTKGQEQTEMERGKAKGIENERRRNGTRIKERKGN